MAVRYDNDMVKQVAKAVASGSNRLKEMMVATAARHIVEICDENAPDAEFDQAFLREALNGGGTPHEVVERAIIASLKDCPEAAAAIRSGGLWDDEIRDDDIERAAHAIVVEAHPMAAMLWEGREHYS